MLQKPSYLACPYTHHSAEVMRIRYRAMMAATALYFREKQILPLSPINMLHEVHNQYQLSDNSMDYWAFNRSLLLLCSELVVFAFPGWERSTGVAYELGVAETFRIKTKVVDEHDLPKLFAVYDRDYQDTLEWRDLIAAYSCE